MFKKAKVFYIHTVSPMHAGSGSDLGIVDMPIQRETHTKYPKIEASSLKGSIREAIENRCEDEVKIHIIFGYDETNASMEIKTKFEGTKGQFAGAIGFSDVRVLLFPIKSVKDVFAYITCPYVIERYKNELEYCGVKDKFEIPDENSVCENSKVVINNNIVILEEYSIEIKRDKTTNEFAEFLKSELGFDVSSKLVVLSNDDFRDFVNMFTEVITRTKIDNEKGTVKEGALFTEEYLPAETVMYSLVLSSPIKAVVDEVSSLDENEVLKFFKENIGDVIQIGGNATIGKGLCKIIIKKDSQ